MSNKTRDVDIARLPSLSGSRNQFNYSKRHFTTCNVGEITPIYHNMLVEPGDTISIDIASLIRTTTLLYPSYDNLICEIFAFSITNNELYEHWNELQGENKTGDWLPTIEYSLPQIIIPQNTKIDPHGILAHMCFPIQTGNYTGAKMGLDMYHNVCNEYFNNNTVMPPVAWSKGDENVTYDGTTTTGGALRRACKLPDYFNAGVPQPLRGNQVNIPFVSVPVIGNGITLGLTNGTTNYGLDNGSSGLFAHTSLYGQDVGTSAGTGTGGTSGVGYGVVTDPEKSGLVTDAQGSAIALNSLRIAATQMQVYEADAYFGARARDIIKSRWQVTTSAESLHIPEFLGYAKFSLDTFQVAQSIRDTANEQELGDLGAYSQTGNLTHLFTKSFDYWSNILIVTTVRQEQHTYAQGLPAQYSKKRRFDFHWPEMEHLGFTATYNKELYMTGDPTKDEGAFNYRPIFQEYRYERDEVTGEFNPSYAQSLDYMLYVDDYDNADGSIGNAPVFSAQFVEETPDNVDRNLVYDHNTVDQIQMAHKFRIRKTSKLSQYGYPGLTRF